MDNSLPAMGLIKKNEVIFFIVLAIMFSWIFWVPLEFMGLDTGNLGTALYYVGVLGPLFAALEILILVGGAGGIKSLVKSIAKWRAGIEWYMIALMLPLAIEAAVLFTIALSGVDLSFNGSNVGDGPSLIGRIYFSIATGIAFFGFLLPRLLKSFSPLISSLIMSIFFIVWDAPFVLVSINTGRADYEFWWAIGNIGIFFVFTWLYRNSKGSLLPMILLNFSLNYFRWFARGVMESSTMNDVYSLDFSLHAVAGIIILLANWKYFMGKAPVSAESPEAIPGV